MTKLNRAVADPGRPGIGPAFSVKFPIPLRDRVDAAARRYHTSRAGLLRRITEEWLAHHEKEEGHEAESRRPAPPAPWKGPGTGVAGRCG